MLKRYGIGICCYILLFFFPLFAQPQLQVAKNNYPTWQVVNDTRESCYPSAAYVSFSNLTRGEKYLYRAFFSRSSGGDFGEVYNAEAGEFVDHGDIGNLPIFTATSGDTAFLVVYRTVPDMLGQLGHWDLNFQARDVNAGGFEGGKTVPDTVGSGMDGSNEFPMGYLQFSGDVLNQASQSAGRGLRKAVAVDGSPVRGMYITEPNGIPEGFPDIDGYYFLAYPAADYDTLRVGMRSLDNDPLGFDYLTNVRISLGKTFDVSGPQIFGYIGPNDYPRWQYLHDSDPDACYPSAARVTLTGLRVGKEYALSARFYRLLEGSFGSIYDPQSESFIKWDDTSNLPRFTATRNDTALWVIYRTDPQMNALDNPFGSWLLSVNAAEVGAGGFSADLALPLLVGNESSELFPMGFIEAPTSQQQPATPVENRIMAIRHSASGYFGMYITEDNGIAEKFPSEKPGYYYIPYPAGQFRELFFQTRNRDHNSPLGQTSQKDVFLPAGGTLQGDATLPVSLLTFQAFPLNQKVQLNWSTASETNNLGFEIWRALRPEGEFRKIADYDSDPGLLGGGNSNVQLDYQYIDEALQNGVTYFYQLSDVSMDGQRTFHQVVSATPGEETPRVFSLSQNYPNPFNPETTIEYTIGGETNGGPVPVSLQIYNNLGQQVRMLEAGRKHTGSYRVVWNGRDDRGHPLPSGVFFCVLKVRQAERVVKMLLLR